MHIGGVNAVLGLWEKAAALTDVEETLRACFQKNTFPVVKSEAGKRGSASAKPGPKKARRRSLGELWRRFARRASRSNGRWRWRRRLQEG